MPDPNGGGRPTAPATVGVVVRPVRERRGVELVAERDDRPATSRPSDAAVSSLAYDGTPGYSDLGQSHGRTHAGYESRVRCFFVSETVNLSVERGTAPFIRGTRYGSVSSPMSTCDPSPLTAYAWRSATTSRASADHS